MDLVGKPQLRKDARKHGDAKRSVEAWISVVEEAEWNNITEVKRTYSSADYVKGKTVFNIKGKSYRLIVLIDYSLQLITYKAFLTHAEYDQYKF
ncbi:MAG: type II toxin-antitoxin system HigB family toxin [Symploca sp. SIO2B6]|nr:type II toxin-antitoxin system HigB family toxin [Symploca sp. SIO2B6]